MKTLFAFLHNKQNQGMIGPDNFVLEFFKQIE